MGQVRVLGTKQHLKSKFGSGYELTVKLKMTEVSSSSLDSLSKFVVSMFPSAKFISDNGGLVTYTIPLNEMNIGMAFTEFEAKKAVLLVEDYSIAQSTLEQVFIRTVQTHTPASKLRLSSLEHPSSWRSSSRQRLDEDIAGQGDPEEEAGVMEEAFVVLNSCGCTTKFVKISTAVTFLAFLLFLIVSIVAKVPALLALAVVFLIAFSVCCVLCCCPCCQPPKDDEE